MAAELLLEVKDLHVSFRVYNGLAKVLNSVSLKVHQGERVGLIGETGCGKTTTLRSVMRILPVEGRIERGQVLYRGKDVLSMQQPDLYRFRRRGAAMIFQDPTAALNPVFTVGQLLREVVKSSVSKRIPVTEQNRISLEALRAVALPDPQRLLDNYPFQLSGGMRQRICIAMALGVDRELVLADEPGTSLDVTIQDQILRLINSLVETRGLSVVLVTHSLGVVRETTDRVYVMYAGSIVESAPVKSLFARPLHPYTMALFDCIPKLSGKRISEGIPGRMASYLDPPPGCRFHPRCPRAMPQCATARPLPAFVDDGHEVACFLHGSPEGDADGSARA